MKKDDNEFKEKNDEKNKKLFFDKVNKFSVIFSEEIVPILKKHNIQAEVCCVFFGGFSLRVASDCKFNLSSEELFELFKHIRDNIIVIDKDK